MFLRSLCSRKAPKTVLIEKISFYYIKSILTKKSFQDVIKKYRLRNVKLSHKTNYFNCGPEVRKLNWRVLEEANSKEHQHLYSKGE